MKCTLRRTVLAGLFCLAAAGAPAADVPTWQAGDWWNVKQSFTIRFGTTTPVNLALNMSTTDTFRLTVADIADRTTTGGQPVRVYRRTRSNSSVTGRGSFTSGVLTITFRWKSGTKTTGEDWSAVSDLSTVRDQFRLTSGTLEALVLIFWLPLATITIESTTDANPPHEVADFPLTTIGEQWQAVFWQRSYGRIRVVWNPLFGGWGGSAPPDIDQSFDTSVPMIAIYRYTGREARGGFPQTYHIEQPPAGSLWYEPTIKEFVESAQSTGNLGGDIGFENMTRLITGRSLATDPNIQNLTFAPTPAYRGRRVTLSGTTTAGTTVTATILGEGASDRTRADSLGRFDLSLVCPNHDDNSPSNDDVGSFGVEVVAQGVGRKVVTLRLDLPPTSTRRGWQSYR